MRRWVWRVRVDVEQAGIEGARAPGVAGSPDASVPPRAAGPRDATNDVPRRAAARTAGDLGLGDRLDEVRTVVPDVVDAAGDRIHLEPALLGRNEQTLELAERGALGSRWVQPAI